MKLTTQKLINRDNKSNKLFGRKLIHIKGIKEIGKTKTKRTAHFSKKNSKRKKTACAKWTLSATFLLSLSLLPRRQ